MVKPKQPAYSYYDTPDGQDYSKKLWYLLRPSFKIGGMLAIQDVLMISKPVGYWPVVERIIRIGMRPPIMSFLFTTTVFTATKFRGKDDPWNHALAGVVLGTYIGHFLKTPASGFLCGGYLSVGLALCKYGKQDGVVFLPDEEYSQYLDFESEMRSYKKDRWYWVNPDVPKGWIKAEEVSD